jgi:transcriptional regulator with XRE-family HTH domain
MAFGLSHERYPQIVFRYQLTCGRESGLQVLHKQVTGDTGMSGEKFGEFVRRERVAKEIGLREMAKMIGVSPTYLSKIERDEFRPPVEDKVRAIAKIINCDADELLARAGRVSSDLSDIIKRRPIELAALLRTTNGLDAADIARLADEMEAWKCQNNG